MHERRVQPALACIAATVIRPGVCPARTWPLRPRTCTCTLPAGFPEVKYADMAEALARAGYRVVVVEQVGHMAWHGDIPPPASLPDPFPHCMRACVHCMRACTACMWGAGGWVSI